METRRLFSILFTAGLLGGCQAYQVTLNETVVYSPPTLFTDFTTEDPRLRNCLDQALEDQQATSALELTRLSCSHAGLTSIKGLELFIGLQELQLSHNALTDLQPLTHLAQLEVLLVDNNNLLKIPEVLTLGKLQRLDASANSALACGDLQQFQASYTGQLSLPEQCDE